MIEGARAKDGQPGSMDSEGRSLHVDDRLVDVDLIHRGATRHQQLGGLS
jgi:hypothetical protein